MSFLTRFSLRNPVAIILLAVLIAVGGIFSATNLKQELMPNVAFPVIAVVTPFPGASPKAVADEVTGPLEDALQGVANVQSVTSTSVENASEIALEFGMSVDLASATQKVQQIVNGVKLPTGAMTPTVNQFSFNSSPVLQFTVASKTASSRELRDVTNHTILPALKGVAGVASIQTGGAAPDSVSIVFDPKKLAKHNLTVAQALQDLQADNVAEPLGSAVVNQKETPVELSSPIRSLADIGNLSLPVQPSASAGTKQIGQSMAALGQAIGSLGSGMEGLGQGIGALQAENQLLTALQQIQGQLFGVELALNQELQKPQNQQDQAKIKQYQGQVAALEASQKSVSTQLQTLQRQMAKGTSGTATSTSAPSISTAHSSSSSSSQKLQTVKLKDVATIRLAPTQNASINRTNGQPSVLVGVVKTEDANTVQMAAAVTKELNSLQDKLPSGIHIVTLYNAATSIQSSIAGLLREAILGALFAVLVILLFLRNGLTTLIAVVSIPLSLLTAIILLNYLNVTLNIMTLGGMAIATGRVVDDSIVVIENIYRAWRRGYGTGKRLVLFGTREVASAITSSTITTVAVFLPLGFVTGIVGKIFFPFALTVVCSLLSSLLVALTVVPLLAYLFVTRRRAKDADYGWLPEDAGNDGALHQALTNERDRKALALAGTGQFRPWQLRYQRALDWCLRHKGWVLLVTAVVFVASIAVLPLAGSTFLPETNEKYVQVSVTMPTGTTRADTDAKAKQIEQIVESHHGTVTQEDTQVGSDPTDGTSAMSGNNTASLFVELNPKTDVKSFVATLRQQLKSVAGPATVEVDELSMGGASGQFGIVITGPDSATITSAAKRVTNAVMTVPGIANVVNNLAATRPEVSVQPDTKKAAEYGLTPYQIGSLVQDYVSNNKVGTVDLGGQTYDMTVSLKPDKPLQSLSLLKDLSIQTPVGKTVKLSDVANVTMVNSPVSIQHRDGNPYATVTGKFTGTNTDQATKLALQKIAALHLPSSVQTQLSGDSQQQNQSFQDLIDAILISVGLVYLVMLITFGEWSAPFAILFAMPVALIGAFFGTVIGRQPVSVSSLIGILMLMGIVVTNAIVLVDRVEQQRRLGLTIRESLLEAGTTRLRPIVMTAVATICALFPLALGFSEGALISQGLAVVVIGGLITSTALTLVIVPVIYELLHFRKARRERLG